uniref:Uncharacterized protein n=1 Tax=Acrobeloides nanus TaxID=290746 RepID=A0A914E3W6_9BILA
MVLIVDNINRFKRQATSGSSLSSLTDLDSSLSSALSVQSPLLSTSSALNYNNKYGNNLNSGSNSQVGLPGAAYQPVGAAYQPAYAASPYQNAYLASPYQAVASPYQGVGYIQNPYLGRKKRDALNGHRDFMVIDLGQNDFPESDDNLDQGSDLDDIDQSQSQDLLRAKRQSSSTAYNNFLQALLNYINNYASSYYLNTPYMSTGYSLNSNTGSNTGSTSNAGGQTGLSYPTLNYGYPSFGMGRKKRDVDDEQSDQVGDGLDGQDTDIDPNAEQIREKRQNYQSTLNNFLQSILNYINSLGYTYYVRTPYMDAGYSLNSNTQTGTGNTASSGANTGASYPTLGGFGGYPFGRKKRQAGFGIEFV